MLLISANSFSSEKGIDDKNRSEKNFEISETLKNKKEEKQRLTVLDTNNPKQNKTNSSQKLNKGLCKTIECEDTLRLFHKN